MVYTKGGIIVLIDELFTYIDENKNQILYHKKLVRPYGSNTDGFIREINVDAALAKLVKKKRAINSMKEIMKGVGVTTLAKDASSTSMAIEKSNELSESARQTNLTKQIVSRSSSDVTASCLALDTYLDRNSAPTIKQGRKRRMGNVEVVIEDKNKLPVQNCKRSKLSHTGNQNMKPILKTCKRKINEVEPNESSAPVSKQAKRQSTGLSVSQGTRDLEYEGRVSQATLSSGREVSEIERQSRLASDVFKAKSVRESTEMSEPSGNSSFNKEFTSAHSFELIQPIDVGQNSHNNRSHHNLINVSNGTQQSTASNDHIYENAEQQRLATECEMNEKKRKRFAYPSKSLQIICYCTVLT